MNPAEELIKNINFHLLREQKQILIEYIIGQEIEQAEAIEGFLSLIDAIQDCAVDELGIDEKQVYG